MAAAALLSKCFSNLLFFSFFLAAASVLLFLTPSSAYHEFRVGGPRGWVEPAGNEPGTLNHWASRNRFHLGDSLYFEYENGSVLQVDKEHYKECNGTDPVARFDDGHTTFRFDSYGFFFFISGEPGHCELGQRMIVRVMMHPGGTAAAGPEAPSPAMGLGGTSPETGMSGRPEQSTSDAASTSITAAATAMIAAMAVPAVALATVSWLGY